jgi:aryl-alcohol dehydrogenase-like predicted oxidoreductase
VTSVRRAPLGRSGLHVAPIAFGGNVFGWTVDEGMAFRLLDAFVDAGFNLIDTADTYSAWVPGHSGGESERIIGRWLKARGRRDDVVLATKVGMAMGDGSRGLSRDHIRRSVRDSLERLGTRQIDLYQSHIDDESVPLRETLSTYRELQSEGAIRAIGASNYSPARLRESLAVSRTEGLPQYECVQPRYNLVDRSEFESELDGLCRQEGLGVITYSSLASGFLTGKYRTAEDAHKSPRGGRAVQRLGPRGEGILTAIDSVSQRLQAPRSTVALAWLLSRPAVTAPIASATSPDQLRELLMAPDLHLDRAALDELDRASA